jgi:hypothetical protein
MEPCIRVGIDVSSRAHRVGVAGPDGALLEEFDISHTGKVSGPLSSESTAGKRD